MSASRSTTTARDLDGRPTIGTLVLDVTGTFSSELETGGRPFRTYSPAVNGELTGRARLGRRTKDLVKQLRPDEIAIVDHADLDRVSAEELAETGVRAVVNVAPSTTGRFPNPGPLELVRAGVRLIDAPDTALFEVVSDGDLLRVEGGEVWRNGTLVAAGTVLDAASLETALAEQQGTCLARLEAFAENTLAPPPRGGGRAAHGASSYPRSSTRFRDRHALVVARGPGYKSDLRMVRPYIRDFRPVLVAVDGGADALREVGLAARRDRRGLRLRLRRGAARGRRARRPWVSGRRGAGRRAAPPARAPASDRVRAGDQRGPRAPARAREGRDARSSRSGRTSTSSSSSSGTGRAWPRRSSRGSRWASRSSTRRASRGS